MLHQVVPQWDGLSLQKLKLLPLHFIQTLGLKIHGNVIVYADSNQDNAICFDFCKYMYIDNVNILRPKWIMKYYTDKKRMLLHVMLL